MDETTIIKDELIIAKILRSFRNYFQNISQAELNIMREYFGKHRMYDIADSLVMPVNPINNHIINHILTLLQRALKSQGDCVRLLEYHNKVVADIGPILVSQ